VDKGGGGESKEKRQGEMEERNMKRERRKTGREKDRDNRIEVAI
jgi:hypothetical protein